MDYDLLNTPLAGVVVLIVVLGGILGLGLWANGRHAKKLMREGAADRETHLHTRREQMTQSRERMDERAARMHAETLAVLQRIDDRAVNRHRDEHERR